MGELFFAAYCNAQNAIAFARRNRPRVNRSGEFACIYLRLRVLFAIERMRAIARTLTPFKVHQINLHVHGQWSRSFISFVLVTKGM